MLEIFWFKIVGYLIRLLPSFILSRIIRSENIKEDFEVDLRSRNPISLSINSSLPSLNLWLRYTNKSPISVEVDRVLIEIWIGQPFIYGSILNKVEIKPKETVENIHFITLLNELQKANILAQLNVGITGVTVNLVLFCNSKIGSFKSTFTIERDSII